MKRVLSGMRPTGKLHIGHYFGALKNWVKMQDEYDCFYFIADWHALTTNYENPEDIIANRREMVLDWLAAGIDPEKATLFIQSKNLYHAELFVLLGMITPIGWLERSPSYKEMREEIKDKDLGNLGFLGYPVLQTADIILYQASYVPVGIDQMPHIEISREIVRRFHHHYKCECFVEPKGLLTEVPKLPGLDGRKMSKSYGNAIMMDEDLKDAEQKIKRMKTDPARMRRTDPGNPEVCPVFDWHKVFSTEDERAACAEGCRTAGIGCIDCKMVLLPHVIELIEPMKERRATYAKDIDDIDAFLMESQQHAAKIAGETMMAARSAMKI